jgi:uncharacterized membrane protein YcaP (DUF421 family)
MSHDLIHLDVPAWDLVLRAVVVYVSILVLLRVSGKRQLGQMGAGEFVAILLISNAVQNSMNGGDNSLVGGLLLATVIISLSAAYTYATYRSKFCSVLLEGTPRLMVHDGKPIARNFRKERLSMAEMTALLRKQGVHHISELKSAVLESDGTLSITRFRDPA